MTLKTVTGLTPVRGPGRPREFNMDQVLDQAILTFRSRGYTATSIGDLSRATGLTAGSLYKAFADKHALFAAAFDRYTLLRNNALRERLGKVNSGRERLREILLFYAEASHDIEGRRGCMVVGGAVELNTYDRALADGVARALQRNEAQLAELIGQGKADGSITADIDVDTAARLVLCILLGMRVAGKTGRTREEMAGLVELALKVVG